MLASQSVQQGDLRDESVEHENQHEDGEDVRVLSVGSWVIDHWLLTHHGEKKDAGDTAEVADDLDDEDRSHNLNGMDLRVFFGVSASQNV